MLVRREVVQGRGDRLSVVSHFPAHLSVEASPHLHALIQPDQIQRRLVDGAKARRVVTDLVEEGIGLSSGDLVSREQAHTIGQQFSDGIMRLQREGQGYLRPRKGDDFLNMSIRALGRVVGADADSVSQGARIAAARAQFELRLAKVATHDDLGQVVACVKQGDLFMEGVPLLRDAVRSDRVPHRHFDRHPKLLANAVIQGVGVATANTEQVRRVAFSVLRTLKSPKQGHTNIVAVAASEQSSHGGLDLLGSSRDNYPKAVEIILGKVFDEGVMPVIVAAEMQQIRNLVMKTAVVPPQPKN